MIHVPVHGHPSTDDYGSKNTCLVSSVRVCVTVTPVCWFTTGTYHNTDTCTFLSDAVCFLSKQQQLLSLNLILSVYCCG